MYREIQQLTGGNRGVQGVTGDDSGREGMCTGADRDCRVCRECVQGLTGGAQGMAGKHWGGGGRGRHYILIRKGFSEPVVLYVTCTCSLLTR